VWVLIDRPLIDARLFYLTILGAVGAICGGVAWYKSAKRGLPVFGPVAVTLISVYLAAYPFLELMP